MKIHLLQLQNVPILEQLQMEEALLRADTRNWCIINTGAPEAIVMGISGKQHELVNPENYQARPVPLIRRFSGGGTVFVDPNTIFVTFICNSQETVECFPEQVHHWVKGQYEPIFNSPSFSLRENDYIWENRKFGGNAQYLSKGRWLHHSTLLWDYKADSMDYLLMPPKTPAYRQKRTHQDFLCKLKEHFPLQQDLVKKIYTHLNQAHTLIPEKFEASILHAPHRKATQLVELSDSP